MLRPLDDEGSPRCTSSRLARFVEAAQIGGQLQHPGIVPVYELGLQAGERPYFAMKLIKGETLPAQLARRSEATVHWSEATVHRVDATQDRRRLPGIFEQVCQTMAYAHARRVVHRDLAARSSGAREARSIRSADGSHGIFFPRLRQPAPKREREIAR